MTDNEKRRLRQHALSAFSPSAPIAVENLFAGRRKQLRTLLDAVAMRGLHAIMYGERGVGKTSLARVLSAFIHIDGDGENVETPYTSCDSTDTFDSVWRKVFGEIPVIREGATSQPIEETAVDSAGDAPFTPDWVRKWLEHYSQGRKLIVTIDEFDCLTTEGNERRLFAETIKLLSDRAVPVTVVMVGVADDVTTLLADHASIDRALVQVQMPRMSLGELKEIIDKSLNRAQMKILPDATDKICYLSQGLPHYTHLLGLEAAKQAIDSDSKIIRPEHVEPAIKSAIENAQASIKDSYHKATTSPHKDNLFGAVLLACAVAQGDDQGYFAAADVREPMCKIQNQKYEIPAFSKHLHDFCEPNRGSVLRRIGVKHSFRFRFSNPLLQPYVIMKGLAAGKLMVQTETHST